MIDIKDGDYFQYSYKVGLGPSSDPYWCRDRRCVARFDEFGDIVLVDTFDYWPFKDKEYDKEIFTYQGLTKNNYIKYINTHSFDLEFICNLNDYEYVNSYEKDDYENVIYVGYQCEKLWAMPKGQGKSKTAILKKLEVQLEKAYSDQRSAQLNIEWITKQIEDLQ